MVPIEIWGETFNSHLTKFKTTRNKIIKYILTLYNLYSTDLTLKADNVFNLYRLFLKKKLLLGYKNKNCICTCEL